MTRLRPFLFAALFCAAASFSPAAGLYIKASGLYSQPGDIKINSASAFKASLRNNTGFSGALGYKFSLLRLEAELQHLRNGANSGSTATGAVATTGGLKEFSGFVNAFVDFPSVLGLSPYLGAGLGVAKIDLDNLGGTQGSAPVARYSGGKSVFGYQGALGFQFHLFGAATLNAGFRLVKREDIAVHDVLANAQQTLKLGTNRVFELGVALGF